MDGFSDSSKRSRPGAKRFDLTDLREALKDGRVWTGIGVVWKPPDQAAHYDLEPDGSGTPTEVLVHVQKMPSEEPLLCYLACSGVWRIPPVGSVVALLIPDGELDTGAIIVGVLASGAPPSTLDADTAALKVPKIKFESTTGDAEMTASGSVKLGGGTTAAVIDTTAFALWMNQVETAINLLAGGSVSPLSTAITYQSAKVKA